MIECPLCLHNIDDNEYINHLLNAHIDMFIVWVSTLSPVNFPLTDNFENEEYNDVNLNLNSMVNLATIRYLFSDDDIDEYIQEGITDINIAAPILTSIVNQDCPICLEQVNEPRETAKCKHVFCSKCIERWCEKHKTCPMCVAILEDTHSQIPEPSHT